MANIRGKNLKGIDKLHEYSKGELLRIPIHSVLRLDATRKIIPIYTKTQKFLCVSKNNKN